jgi:hypothetical protein
MREELLLLSTKENVKMKKLNVEEVLSKINNLQVLIEKLKSPVDEMNGELLELVELFDKVLMQEIMKDNVQSIYDKYIDLPTLEYFENLSKNLNSLRELVTNRIIINQTYIVKFDTLTPVDINVTVQHLNTTQLTRDEIVKEAMGYLEQVNINYISESDIFEIETVNCE